MSVGDGVAQGDGLCSIFFGILTVYDMTIAEHDAAAEADGGPNVAANVDACPIIYADDVNIIAPHDHRSKAAMLYSNFPAPLTDGTACCTRTTCTDIETLHATS